MIQVRRSVLCLECKSDGTATFPALKKRPAFSGAQEKSLALLDNLQTERLSASAGELVGPCP